MQPGEEDKPAQNVTEEGEKVTGGEETARPEASETTSDSAGGAEIPPESSTKKEDMTSYNEHPDQEKVGGG